MKKSLLVLIFIAFFTLHFNNAFAQPANDYCQDVISLTSTLTCNYTTGSTLGATQSITGSCSGNGDDDVWYRFVAQSNTETVKVQSYGGFDAVLDIRNAPACSASNIMCVDGAGVNGLETANLTSLVVGATYVVRVYHYGTGDAGGDFDICVTHTAPAGPVNDFCSDVITLTSSLTCNYTTGSTLGATQSITGSCTGNGDDDVWYQFVAQATSHTVKVQGFGAFDAVVDIRSNSSCSGTNIMCTDASGAAGLETANLTSLTIGSTYLIRVYHYGAGDGGGDFDICVTHTAPVAPPNDLCSDVISLSSSLNCNYTSGYTTGATQTITGNCTGNGDDDVWYSFTAVATSHTVKVQSGTGFDAVIDIRSNSSCSGTNIQCADASGSGGLETANLTGLTIGSTYLVRVYHFGAGAGSGNFQICVTHTVPAAPANDFCSDDIVLTSSLTCNYVTGSTTGATQSIPGVCAGNGDDDVWYSFTAVSTNQTVKVQSGSGFDAVVDIRDGSSCSGANIACSDASGAAGLETSNLTGLTVGSVYLVRVYHFGTGAGTGDFQICVTNTAPSCTYSITPINLSFSASAGNGTVNVTTASGCTWTATSNDSWITVTSGSTGTGNGTVTYSVSANTGTTQRTGTITIAGLTHTVAQSGTTSCTFTISPLNLSFTSSAGNGTVNVTAASGCNWVATANDSWITVTSGSTGSGNGTVTYSITANTNTAQRVGTITVAGQIHTVIQNGIVPCSYTISPTALSYSSSAGTGTVNVTTTNGCNWTASSTDSWITITSGSSGSGNGTVTYSVSANSGSSQRTGTITIAGQAHTVVQSGTTSCTYTISPANLSFSSSAGNGTVTVTAAGGCNWTATANDAWITVTSGSTGSGNGTVTYSVAANTASAQRVGTITIAGQIHTVIQSGVTACSYTISPTSLSYSASGGSGAVNVTTASGCTWTATSNNSWITITSGSSGSGNGTVNYTVAANTGTTQLTGTITVAGQTHTVTQSGLNCSYVISTTALSFTSSAGTGTINVTTATGCTWTATSNDSWLTITSGSSGSGNGTVNYTVAANTGTTQRLGSISIAGLTHSVVQNSSSACTYTIAPTALTFTSAAGNGTVTVATAAGCSWTAISNDSWIFISSGNNGSGNGTVNYSVAVSQSSSQRIGSITIAGQIHTVTQTGVTCPPVPVMQSVGCALAANQISNVSYQWYISGTPIIGANTQYYTANQPGFYSVYVTDNSNGCVVGSQPAYVTCSGVGVEEIDLADAILIYPNPSSGSFNIKSSTIFSSEKVSVSIINMYGQEIYSSSVIPVKGEITLTIDKINPAKGAYTVLFRSGNTKIIKRVLIQ